MLLIVDVYIGYLHQSNEITIDGYHLMHFITLYVLAGTLRRMNLLKLNVRKLFVCLILLLVLMTGFHMCKMVFPPTAVLYSLRYNSPMLMVASVLIFLLFANLKIMSRAINWVSESVLAVYLISTLPFFGPRYYRLIKQLSVNYSGLSEFFLILVTMICFYSACILGEKLRKFSMRYIEERV